MKVSMRILVLLLAASAAVAADQPPPSVAISARIAARESYRLVFDDEFDDAATIGEAPGAASGAKWFRSFFFGQAPSPPQMFKVADGTLTLTGTTALGATIATAGSVPGPTGWGGRVFRNGAYFEARIALGPDQPGSGIAWPAFWAMAIEHMAMRGEARWPGQPADFLRFAEDDFFEYNPNWYHEAYIATMHEWYGRWQGCGVALFCEQSNAGAPNHVVGLPPRRDGPDYHVFGQVWVPATARARGYVQNFLDAQPVGARVEWDRGEPQPPAAGSFRFNVIDRQGMVVILTSGQQPMTVDWVRVWQLPSGIVEQR